MRPPPGAKVADPRPRPALSRLPTLTEVVMEGRPPSGSAAVEDVPVLSAGADRMVERVPEQAPEPVADRLSGAPAEGADAILPPLDPADEARIIDAVIGGLQPRIDLMLEYRLREALAPVLARASDAIVRDARGELAQTLRDVVARAVAQELARRRAR